MSPRNPVAQRIHVPLGNVVARFFDFSDHKWCVCVYVFVCVCLVSYVLPSFREAVGTRKKFLKIQG